jgi:hypothetical protein
MTAMQTEILDQLQYTDAAELPRLNLQTYVESVHLEEVKFSVISSGAKLALKIGI